MAIHFMATPYQPYTVVAEAADAVSATTVYLILNIFPESIVICRGKRVIPPAPEPRMTECTTGASGVGGIVFPLIYKTVHLQ